MNYSTNTVRELVEIIEERNDTIQRLNNYNERLYGNLRHVLNTFVETEDGYYIFPDNGECLPCKQTSPTPLTLVVDVSGDTKGD